MANDIVEQENAFVTIRLPESLKQEVDKIAMESMRSRSAQIIVFIMQGIERAKLTDS